MGESDDKDKALVALRKCLEEENNGVKLSAVMVESLMVHLGPTVAKEEDRSSALENAVGVRPHRGPEQQALAPRPTVAMHRSLHACTWFTEIFFIPSNSPAMAFL